MDADIENLNVTYNLGKFNRSSKLFKKELEESFCVGTIYFANRKKFNEPSAK